MIDRHGHVKPRSVTERGAPVNATGVLDDRGHNGREQCAALGDDANTARLVARQDRFADQAKIISEIRKSDTIWSVEARLRCACSSEPGLKLVTAATANLGKTSRHHYDVLGAHLNSRTDRIRAPRCGDRHHHGVQIVLNSS